MRDGDDQRTDDAAREDPGRSLGEMLRAARAALDLSLEEAAADLRIEEDMLRALEEHRFEALGAPVFAKGYLKQYAQRLNLSCDEVLAEYYRLAEPRDVQIAPSKVIKLRDERQVMISVMAGVALALLAAILFTWWLTQPTTTFAPTVTPPSEDTFEPALEPNLEPLLLPGAEPVDEGPAGALGEAPSPIDDETAVVDEGSVDEEAPGARQADADPEASPAPQAVTEVTPGDLAPEGSSLRVVLDFREDSWVAATDVEGRRLYYGLGRAGARSAFVGRPPIDITLGNADGVNVEVEGEPYAVPEAVRQGNVARFTLDSN